MNQDKCDLISIKLRNPKPPTAHFPPAAHLHQIYLRISSGDKKYHKPCALLTCSNFLKRALSRPLIQLRNLAVAQGMHRWRVGSSRLVDWLMISRSIQWGLDLSVRTCRGNARVLDHLFLGNYSSAMQSFTIERKTWRLLERWRIKLLIKTSNEE